jgi:uncharacterized protein YkwD
MAAVFAFAPAVASASCAGADTLPLLSNTADVEATTLCLLNEQRAANGLRPLVRNGVLDRASRAYSQDMVARSFFEHVSPGGSTPRQRMEAAGYSLRGIGSWAVGENIAWGTGLLSTPGKVVSEWMESPGHRENILKSTYREIGIGVALGVPLLRLQAFPGATYTTDFGYRLIPAPRRAGTHRSCTRRTRSSRRATRCRR